MVNNDVMCNNDGSFTTVLVAIDNIAPYLGLETSPSTPRYAGSSTSGRVHSDLGSVKPLGVYRTGRPDAVVYMHWREHTTATKDGAQLERLLMRVHSQNLQEKRRFL